MTEGDIIKELGFSFRSLILHSSGEWTCDLGYRSMYKIKGGKCFRGTTALEALQKALDFINKIGDE